MEAEYNCVGTACEEALLDFIIIVAVCGRSEDLHQSTTGRRGCRRVVNVNRLPSQDSYLAVREVVLCTYSNFTDLMSGHFINVFCSIQPHFLINNNFLMCNCVTSCV